MSRILVGIAACALMVLATPALAQRGGRGGFGTISKVQLLQSEQIQKELELADDQKAQVTKIAEDSRNEFQDVFASLRDLSQEERGKKLAEVRGKIDKKAEDVLLDHQKTRLNELYIQVQGSAALSDAKVAEALKITDDQKSKIAAARDEMMQALRDARGDGGNFDREKTAQIRRDGETKVLAVLTADQKAQFEKMQGKKIEIDRQALGRGFGGRGRRGGGNQ
jgi:Spy/CpxP family protein refolding chaperone